MRGVRVRGMSGEHLRLLRVKHQISQAAVAKRMRLTTRSRLSALEQQKYVRPETALRYFDALLKEQYCRDAGIDLDYDPEDWGLAAKPAKPLEMEYRWRPRDKRGRWLPSGGRIPQQPEAEPEPERSKQMIFGEPGPPQPMPALQRPPEQPAATKKPRTSADERANERIRQARQRAMDRSARPEGGAEVIDVRWQR